MKPERKNLAASVHDRLLKRSHERGEDFSFVLHRYAAERFLYRLGLSTYREQLVLKGAMLFAVWGGSAYRPTRDLDFTGYGNSDADAVLACFRKICDFAVPDDALVFDSSTLTAEQIRDDAEYDGLRVRLVASLGSARIPLQIDVGFGNAIEPRPNNVEYPTLLDGPSPRIRAYPHEAVIAEKFHCTVRFGERNSRLKDFYDLYVLAHEFSFAGEQLTSAIAATFKRRNTPIEPAQPVALAPRFYADTVRATQWRTYLERNHLPGAPADFDAAGELIRQFLGPVWSALAENVAFASVWRPGDAWNSEDGENTILTTTSTPPSTRSQEQQRSHDTDTLATAELELQTAIPLRRFKPYPAYKDSAVEWLGEIPAHWEVRKVRRIIQTHKQGYYTEQAYVDDGVKLARITDIDNFGRVSFEEMPFVEVTPSDEQTFKLEEGDFLFARSGTIGRFGIVRKPERSVFASYLIRFRFRMVEPEFLRFLFASAFFKESLLSTLHGGANQNVHAENIKDQPIVLPPTSEQRAIAAFLDRETAKIDGLVAKKKRLIELLQEKRAALISRAVTKGLDPNVPMKHSGVEWLQQIPEHWQLKRIKNVSTFVTSGSRGWAEYYSEEGPLFLRIGNLESGRIDLNLDDVQHVSPPEGREGERTRVQEGDVLISITALIGAVAVVPKRIPVAFVNQHLALVRISDKRIDPRWLAYCVLSQFGQSQLLAELYGGTKDGLSLDDIRSLVILVPPLDEQQAIVSFLDADETRFSSLLRRISDGIDRTNELRTSLISAAVTGKIDVRGEAA
jgi:type I restriction enzyme S subunit